MEPSPTSSPDLTRDTLSSRSPSMNSTISSDIVNCVTKISLQHIDVTVDGVPATEASAIGNGATIASDEATANGAHYDNVNVNASASIDETSFAVKGDCDMSLNAATNVSADAGACGPPFSSAPLLTPSLSSPATALASVPEGAKEQSGGTESKEQNDTGGDGDDCSENTDNINTIIERDGGGNTIGQKKAVKLQRAMTWTDGGVSPVIDFQQSSDISNAHSTDRSGNATTNKERRTRTKRTQTISPHMEASVKEEEFMGRWELMFECTPTRG